MNLTDLWLANQVYHLGIHILYQLYSLSPRLIEQYPYKFATKTSHIHN